MMRKINIKNARQFLINRAKQRESFLNNRYNQACQDFQKILDKIIKDYNPVRIYQWGSLLNRKHFSELSDIDIAVEGIISAEEIFRLYGDIMDMTDMSVDLIQIEKIEPEFKALIKEKGKIVYER
jgi:predicted nucleotidyltransferase